ncbi:hypothetical protein BC834DRAFT_898427 [Gloeopeniophorella convolvens]|nr:hypothetical protein BC834DRAFT_898427 [Gloeopeniophorella convolvens]
MSFLDTTLPPVSSGTATPPPQAAGQPPPTLNEEVTEVIGQLGRFWGGFRKQSQSAIQAARKDIGEYVSQAQKELNKQIASVSSLSPSDETTSEASSSRELSGDTATDGEGSASSSASASTATLPERQQPQSPTGQTIFARLQSSLPPDLINTLKETIPDTVRQAQERLDFAQAQARMQDAAARSEGFLRGASVFLRDAVRVVPPEEAIISPSPTPPLVREGAVTPRAEVPPPVVTVASTTRRDTLMRSLRSTAAILRVDPASEERSAAPFAAWAGRPEAKPDQTRREVELAADDGALRGTFATLVPTELTEDEFWTRYSFRVHQIDQEEERRKAVLEGSAEQEEDFTWEDEDDETSPKDEHAPTPAVPTTQRDRLSAPATPGNTSPERSEDSYDIVSSGRASAVGDSRAAQTIKKDVPDDDEDDEDEEEDEEEDEDEEDEEDEGGDDEEGEEGSSEGSDWE